MFDSETAAGTYTNPVYAKSFPDPFVLKHAGVYFAYSTGFASDGDVFAILHSRDLVSWSEVGSAMKPLDSSPPFYWAPEVICDNGKFYLYYSVGNETLMELRVAVSDRPDGGFVDSGRKLTTHDFAIDAHVFIDDDGTRWMFYATDFLDHSHIGTGTVVDRMLDLFTLEGEPRPVTRAKYDWQVYDPNRKEKGGVRWHTVEGPTVLKRKGIYYEMFSGGNWQNTTYGVSFALACDIRIEDEWRQFSDGVNVLPILRTIQGVVEGPGHNSVVRGPNNRELYCVYHRWINNERVLAVDRMDFAGDRLFVIGATNGPQPEPFSPSADALDEIEFDGDWGSGKGIARSTIQTAQSFLAELTVSGSEDRDSHTPFGIALRSDESVTAEILFDPASNLVSIKPFGLSTSLPPDFDWAADHLIAIDCDYRRLDVRVDNPSITVATTLDQPVDKLSLLKKGGSVTIRSLQVTQGFEELFEDDQRLEENGWSVVTDASYKIAGGELAFPESGMVVSKGGQFENLDVAVNFRMSRPATISLEFTDDGNESVRVAIAADITIQTESDVRQMPLPANVELSQYHQLRMTKLHGRIICYLDDVRIDELTVTDVPMRFRIGGLGPGLAVEMIRVTQI